MRSPGLCAPTRTRDSGPGARGDLPPPPPPPPPLLLLLLLLLLERESNHQHHCRHHSYHHLTITNHHHHDHRCPRRRLSIHRHCWRRRYGSCCPCSRRSYKHRGVKQPNSGGAAAGMLSMIAHERQCQNYRRNLELSIFTCATQRKIWSCSARAALWVLLRSTPCTGSSQWQGPKSCAAKMPC